MLAPYTFVFVSHVSEDRPAATSLVAKLEARGIPCWVAPRDVNPGRPFDIEINEAIETCRGMLLVFSESCNESDYIRREVTVAGDVGKVIIPYRIEDARPKGGLRIRLSDLHWIDAFDGGEDALDELVRTLLPAGGLLPAPDEQQRATSSLIAAEDTAATTTRAAESGTDPVARPSSSLISKVMQFVDTHRGRLREARNRVLIQRPVRAAAGVAVIIVGALTVLASYSFASFLMSSEQPAAAPVVQQNETIVGRTPRPVYIDSYDHLDVATPPPVEPPSRAAKELMKRMGEAREGFRIPAVTEGAAPVAQAPPNRTGWIIQVGAFTSEAKAKQRLADLQSKASDVLAGTNPFTDTNQINDVTYYRARFGGLDKDRAESACKILKRDYSAECVTIKN